MRNDFGTVHRLMDTQLAEVMQGLLTEDMTTGQVGSLSTRRMLGATPTVNEAAVQLQAFRKLGEIQKVLTAGG